MRILCVSDGSGEASIAVDALLASLDGSSIAVELLVVAAGGASQAASPLTSLEAEATRPLEDERRRLLQAGASVTVATRTGRFADEVIDASRESQPDLVVLGPPPGSDGGPASSGVIATQIVRGSRTSVLIARHSRPIRSVVLGYDGSRGAEAAVSLLIQLPWGTPPRIDVCTAFDLVRPFKSGIAPLLRRQVLAATEADLIEAGETAQAMASEASERLQGNGFSSTAHALEGRPSEQLLVLAGETGADLIAVGARGLSGVERFLLGSVSAELVAVAPTSLLVVRSDAS